MREPIRSALGDLLGAAELDHTTATTREQAAAALAEAARRLLAPRAVIVISYPRLLPAAELVDSADVDALTDALDAWDAAQGVGS